MRSTWPAKSPGSDSASPVTGVPPGFAAQTHDQGLESLLRGLLGCEGRPLEVRVFKRAPRMIEVSLGLLPPIRPTVHKPLPAMDFRVL